jgi:hypothetical protein
MTSPCPCGTFQFPQTTCNISGLPQLSYRVGDFTSFRYQLLTPLPGEAELTAWRPGASGDLAMQMVEWWAYLADILTFYNERIANEAYLDTALLPESVNHLVQLLGYRPKPALGAKGQLAALLTPSARLPLTVPARLQIQSKPGPGEQPQVFEVDQATTIGSPDMVVADVTPSNLPLLDSSGSVFWLAGKVSSLKAGDRLLLANASAINAQTLGDWAWIKVTGITPATDPLGNTVSKVAFSMLSGTLASGAHAANYVLLKSQQSAPLWPYSTSTAKPITATTADLAQATRSLVAGGLFLVDLADGAVPAAATAATAAANAFLTAAAAASAAVAIAEVWAGNFFGWIFFIVAADAMAALATAATSASATSVASAASSAQSALLAGNLDGAAATAASAAAAANTLLAEAASNLAGLTPTPGIVTSYAEVVWYANGDGPHPPPPASPTVTPIAIPHAEISFASNTLSGPLWPFVVPQITVRWGWLPVGQLVAATTPASYVYPSGGNALVADPSSGNPMPLETTPLPVMVEDTGGDAAASTLTSAGSPASASLGTLSPAPPSGLSSPIDIFFNLVGVSRGKTVATETLGSGNPTVAGQDFTLKQSPVTYFFDPASVSGPNFSSTVSVSVNGVAWQEVQSFYGQPKNAQVFLLHEDDQGQTHVSFGDGINGSLLPTGANNVVATYRYGGGAAVPDPETLTVVLTPTPGLKGVRNPLPPTGGADPDQPSQLRSLAPQSVLTFNRAVSLDDYAAIALTASGVTQAAASYAFDPASQRPAVVLWIAGDSNATVSAAAALAGTAMPGQRVIFETALGVTSILSLTYVRDPRYADSAVQAGLMAALADPVAGLFAPANLGIGQPIYQSQIAAACLAVPGVVAIQNVNLVADADQVVTERRFSFILRRFVPIQQLGCSGQVYNPGAGAYFIVPNDTTHVVLSGTVAS